MYTTVLPTLTKIPSPKHDTVVLKDPVIPSRVPRLFLFTVTTLHIQKHTYRPHFPQLHLYSVRLGSPLVELPSILELPASLAVRKKNH